MRVLLTDYAWPDLDLERAILAEAGAELVLAEHADSASLAAAAQGVDAIMTTWAQVTRDVIAAAPQCRIVARLGIGLDNIDVAYCSDAGIPVTNVPGYCTQEVAEHTLALMLAMARNIPYFRDATREGRYQLRAAPPMRRIAGQTLGIIGWGRIGSAVAVKALGLGMRVIAATRHRRILMDRVAWHTIDELLPESDFVSLHLPLTNQSRHLLDARRLAQMKSTAVLINTARGSLVDHTALAEALAAGRLAGAALDVQDPEPPDLSRPPYSDPRVLVTPHAAFLSEQSLHELRTRATRQVVTRLRGGIPDHIVNLLELKRLP
ncbi:MAG: C-terminal binding protein [Pirellulaceae bacterium]